MWLGVGEDEFWFLSPRQFHQRLRSFNELEQARQKRADYRAGVIAAAIENSAPFRESGPASQPHDFFSSLPQPVIQPQSPEEMQTLLHMSLGGTLRKAEA